YNLYEDVILDGHLTGIIGKRMDAVLNKSLFFQDKSGKRVEAMDDLIESEEFRDLIRKAMETLMWGISGVEFIPGANFSFKEVPRKHIKPELGLITYEQYGQEGLPYKEVSNIWIMGKE